MLKLQTILHPTDFSESARSAFQLACSLARDHDAELVVFHVRPIPMIAGEGGSVLVDGEPLDEVLDRVQKSHPSPEGVRTTCQVGEGDAASQILVEAKVLGADLIVMGTHGRTGLGRLLMGSVAEQVMRSASCPVLTMRRPTDTTTTN